MTCPICLKPFDHNSITHDLAGRTVHVDCLRSFAIAHLLEQPAAGALSDKRQDSPETPAAEEHRCKHCGNALIDYGVDWLCRNAECNAKDWNEATAIDACKRYMEKHVQSEAAKPSDSHMEKPVRPEASKPKPAAAYPTIDPNRPGFRAAIDLYREAQPAQAAALIDSHLDLCKRARDIMVAKNHDYRGGSGDPFANFRGSVSLGIHPGVGIMLRMQDKMMRIKTFIEKGELKVKGEGLDDAVLDIINYAVLLRGLLAEDKS